MVKNPLFAYIEARYWSKLNHKLRIDQHEFEVNLSHSKVEQEGRWSKITFKFFECITLARKAGK